MKTPLTPIPPDTIAGLLRWGAEQWPNRHFVRLPDGSTWTRKEALEEALRTASKLRAAGITQGDRVIVMMPNSSHWLRCWWGVGVLGAILVPFNPALRGTMFDAIFDTIDPKAMIVEKGTESLFTPEQRARAILIDDLMARAVKDDEAWPDIRPEDPHAIIMTSGTTGPSKGTLMSNRQLSCQAAWLIEEAGVGARDVFLADMPLFHLSGTSPITLMMRSGGSVALRIAPSLSNYWDLVRELGATFSYLVGTMSGYLLAKPSSPAEREHSLRFVLSAPLPPDIEAFKQRFNMQGLCSCYGASEAGIVIVQSPFEPMRSGSCGKRRSGYEFRLVDTNGNDVADDEVGELLVRNPLPTTMSLGYFGNEAATRTAWEGGWYHSGDLFKRDADGYYYWQDRAKDSLRRRGENISSFEVEREIQAHPAVLEVACVAYPSEFGGDDEVKVFIVPSQDASIDFEEMVHFLATRMPYFMVPRFYELIDAIPKTPSNRAQKHLLRAQGNSSRTWDRQACGITIGRDGKVRQSGAA